MAFADPHTIPGPAHSLGSTGARSGGEKTHFRDRADHVHNKQMRIFGQDPPDLMGGVEAGDTVCHRRLGVAR